MFFVYLLRSQKDNGYYIGQTDDTTLRLERHQGGGVDATKNRLPVTLVYYEAYSTRSEAIEREFKLKQFGSSYVGLLKRLGLR